MKMPAQLSRNASRTESRFCCCQHLAGLASACLSALLIFSVPARALDLADVPLSALVKSPPANIMFVLDDSKSMSCEVSMAGQSDGFYPEFDANGAQIGGLCYIFNIAGGNAYFTSAVEMDTDSRKYWRSQHFADNVVYYNPNVIYDPWTSYPGQSFADANINNPKSNPMLPNAANLGLDDVSFTVALKEDETTETPLAVNHAHFFVKPDGDAPYLVTIDRDGLNYYKVIELEGTGLAQIVTKVQEVAALPPGTITDTVADHRQNFANWFAYHRRREFTAKASMAKTIDQLKGVRVGLLGINGLVLVPLKPVEAKIDGLLLDETGVLLESVYGYQSMGSTTPLIEGLNDAGRYYERNSEQLVGHEGASVNGDTAPFFSEDEGGACQRCFAVVMTDGFYEYSFSHPKYGPIVSATGRVIGNADGPDNTTDFDRPALQDNLSNTLADVAMYYYENDLQPENLPNGVPAYGFDNAAHQHMVTYGVTFGVAMEGIAPENYSINWIYNDSTYSLPWPEDIEAKSPQTITDLWHATLNSRGRFLSTQNPQQLNQALLKTTESITQQVSGSAGAVTLNTTSLRVDNLDHANLFQSSFSNQNDINDWCGDVRAYRFIMDIGRFDLDREPVWSAARQLKLKAWQERNIVTYNPDAKAGRVFFYENLTEAQKMALGWDGEIGSDAEAAARNRVSYLKGADIDGFRARSSVLGDIVHAAPAYENDVVYVGANDGMLHAFSTAASSTNPAPGDELFAYVPNLVFENLAALTQTGYAHKYFVDLTPAIVKGMGLLEGKTPSTATGLQTILVGGLQKGGKGYFALDITDPFAMTTADSVAQKVLWEFSDSDYMGYSYSRPVVVRSYAADHPWVVIFGNGYSSSRDTAALFIIDPLSGIEIKRFILTGSQSDPNGLASPTPVDVNFDQVVDYVYAGDLHGNLWKFDLTAADEADWDVAYKDGSANAPLFQAKGPNGSPQPITTKPEITLHPSQHGFLVLFGTGKFYGESDFSDAAVQTIYGIWDYGDYTDNSEYLGAVERNADGAIAGLTQLSDRSTLLRQQITDFTYTLPNFETVDVRILSQNEAKWQTETDSVFDAQPNPSTTEANHVGWYVDLATRERVVTDVVLRDGKLLIIGFVPNPYQCEPGAGNSWFMEIDAFNGGNLSTVQLDTTGGGILNDNDLVRLNPSADLVPPSGIRFQGKLEMASILRIDHSLQPSLPTVDNGGLDLPGATGTACGEQKYLSSSTGAVRKLCEKSIRLGMVYWQEVQRD